MTASLLIAYPDIASRALEILPSTAYDDLHPVTNVLFGARHALGKTTASGSSTVRYDLGSGVTASSNFVIIARADILKADNCTTLALNGSATTTPGAVYSDASFATATLYGPDSADYIASFAASTAYRYWWTSYTITGTGYATRSKEYFGTLFDMGRDPDMYDVQIADRQGGELSFATGNVRVSRGLPERRVFNIHWSGVTDAKAVSFFSSILANDRQRLVFLYAPTRTEILDDLVLVHCRVLAEQCRLDRASVLDWNAITAVFEEVKG